MRLYLDTSVFGGYFDEEFSNGTMKLFNEIFNGNHKLLISNITLAELEKAPLNVRELLKKVPKKNIEIVQLTEESEN